MKRPGIILTTAFKTSDVNGDHQTLSATQDYFTDALEYLDRDEAKDGKHDFKNYQDYMDDGEKTTGLFDSGNNRLSIKEKAFYKTRFKSAHAQGGIMWQPIFSFDNEWLREQGILKDGIIDDTLLKDATRSAMNKLLEKEGLSGNSYWTAAIHTNTDNIHIHIALVQKQVNRTRGKMKLSSVNACKSVFLNNLVDRSQALKQLDDVLRKGIIEPAREINYQNDYLEQLLNISQISKKQYGRLDYIERRQVDRLTRQILKQEFPEAYKKLQSELHTHTDFYKRAYGKGLKSNYKQFEKTKRQELYTKIGNHILRESKVLRPLAKELEWENKKQQYQKKQSIKKMRNNQHYANYYLRQFLDNIEWDVRKAIYEYESHFENFERE